MYGEQVATPTLVYNFLKKSGLSSGGIILLFPPRLGLGPLGLPATNQAISPIIPVRTMINNHAHLGNLRTFSCGVIAQSINV